jgi:ubiquinone/menaquinone biosynthesis C-methylase UbiE
MSLTTAEWHQRYLEQAQWTQDLRAYTFQKVGLAHAARILDIGCGTGVLEHELENSSNYTTFGLDISVEPLKYAHLFAPQSDYTQGDCLFLPFADKSIDVTFCHFLLLWVKHTEQAVHEMVRVTHPLGYVVALAEPDYGGRIDFPSELSKIGIWQIDSLTQQGANPFVGRELRSIFHHAGLVNIEVGVMGGQWADNGADTDNKLEWEVVRSDLQQNQEFLFQENSIKAVDQAARIAGQRILYVPTFYALGQVRG